MTTIILTVIGIVWIWTLASMILEANGLTLMTLLDPPHPPYDPTLPEYKAPEVAPHYRPNEPLSYSNEMAALRWNVQFVDTDTRPVLLVTPETDLSPEGVDAMIDEAIKKGWARDVTNRH